MIARSGRVSRRVVAFVGMAAISAAAFASSVGLADSTSGKPAHKAATTHGKKSTSTKGHADGGAGDGSSTSAASASAASASSSSDSTDAGAVSTKTADGGAKVFRFGEMEIEGRLKSPQLVYFLRRVRAEFSAGDLGHRSFFPELSETEGDPSFGGGP